MLNTFRQQHPYPSIRPSVPRDYTDGRPTGWCHASCVKGLKSLLTDKMSVVVDGGSWKGKSAHLMLTSAPNATVICVDTWKGSIEHQQRFKEDLATLYDVFCTNLWEYKSRVIPVISNSTNGLQLIHDVGIKPDLIYVDWSHDAENVYLDTTAAMGLFPKAIICGDDYNWKSVKEGLQRLCRIANVSLKTDDVFWQLQR